MRKDKMMYRRIALALWLLCNVSCTDGPSSGAIDGGAEPSVDAAPGHNDAAAPAVEDAALPRVDAATPSAVDAGSSLVDASTDAGLGAAEPDGGSMTADAGTPDGGSMTADAGTPHPAECAGEAAPYTGSAPPDTLLRGVSRPGVAVAVGCDGQPWVLVARTDRVELLERTSMGWETHVVFEGDVRGAKHAIRGSGAPHVAVISGEARGTAVRHIERRDGSWVSTLVDAIGDQSDLSIVVPADGEPLIGFVNGRSALLAFRDGGVWRTEPGLSTLDGWFRFARLALGPSDRPWFVAQRFPSASEPPRGSVVVSERRAPGDWASLTLFSGTSDFEAYPGTGLDASFDDGGRLHLVYGVKDRFSDLIFFFYQRWNGVELLTPRTLEHHGDNWYDLSIDSEGDPHILVGELDYVVAHGTTWSRRNIESPYAALEATASPSIAVDPFGGVHVVHLYTTDNRTRTWDVVYTRLID